MALLLIEFFPEQAQTPKANKTEQNPSSMNTSGIKLYSVTYIRKLPIEHIGNKQFLNIPNTFDGISFHFHTTHTIISKLVQNDFFISKIFQIMKI